MSSPEGKETNIIVNGRPRKVSDVALTFEQIVALAFNPPPANALFTVTYTHGKRGGTLQAGSSVPLENGMRFDVTETGQS